MISAIAGMGTGAVPDLEPVIQTGKDVDEKQTT